ncbi:NAD(P)H-binding protein [Kineosporia sp. J2-2]|uniref:NAD(P)H-binding protein n=1 Tax=Kineosporia corallincola TaxID=2835133 RepID=A0ABS5TC01_9ACTN|nr:NAD(P)H-binding protein [Kineosporia corallincola]MBT0768580.1 NAD(P)H-binding protein [Kineosporia corallincola]
MTEQKTFLVFGATGQTGRHFTALALEQEHRVRVVARNPARVTTSHPNLEVHQGAVPGLANLDGLLEDVDFVVCMLGDARAQKREKVNTAFVRELVPAMRRTGVSRFLYQAGGLSKAPGRELPLFLRVIRSTVARSHIGQHQDNEAVMEYLTQEAGDIEWMVPRAGIGSDGPSRGILERSATAISIGTFRDVAAYNLRTVTDPSAVHTTDQSVYRKG